MNIDDVKKLMKEVIWGDFATTDGEKATVRPMAGWAWMEDELWCMTGTTSDKVSHLKAHPHAEYCFCNFKEGGTQVRIAGVCSISNDNDEKLRLYKANPVLKDHIGEPTSDEYAIIKLKPESIRMKGAKDMQYSEIVMG